MKYAIHEGWVRSKNDEDEHFISFNQLIHLYHLNPKDCIRWNYDEPETYRGRNESDYIHLYPRRDGNYQLPKKNP
jgi:hypothetical protein